MAFVCLKKLGGIFGSPNRDAFSRERFQKLLKRSDSPPISSAPGAQALPSPCVCGSCPAHWQATPPQSCCAFSNRSYGMSLRSQKIPPRTCWIFCVRSGWTWPSSANPCGIAVSISADCAANPCMPLCRKITVTTAELGTIHPGITFVPLENRYQALYLCTLSDKWLEPPIWDVAERLAAVFRQKDPHAAI